MTDPRDDAGSPSRPVLTPGLTAEITRRVAEKMAARAARSANLDPGDEGRGRHDRRACGCEGIHQRVMDDGVAYCGWDGHEGCGESWPCPYVRATSPRS